MFPPFRYMDSHHRDHIPYPCHYYPRWEDVSPQTTVDTLRPPSSFGPWSINGSHAHPTVSDCNSCCSHGYYPGFYGFRPPYPHAPPSVSPQLFYQGPYPPYYGPFPSFGIWPYYPADQNPHGCSDAKAHSCDCPNHACKRGDRNRVKIVEQKSEKDLDDRSSNLIRSPNYPYPVVWMPLGYSRDKETNKSFEAPPAVWDGWIPMDFCNPSSRKLHEDEKNNQQIKERRNMFPWPIIWMPGDEKSEGPVKDLKEISSDPKVKENLPSSLRIIPLKILKDGSHGEKPGDADDKIQSTGHSKAAAEKECRTKTIPVRQIEENGHEKLSIDENNKDRDAEKLINIPVNEKENGAKKSSDSKPGSRASKLSPVCLRVDQLPRKKTVNGRSRSSCPPGLNDKENSHKDETGKKQLIEREKEEMPKRKIKVQDVHDKHEVEKFENKMQDTEATVSNKGAAKVLEIQVNKVDEKQPIDEAPGGNTENIKRAISEPIKERMILSEFDAATLVQSAYRGHEVRRWQPIEKLRKISQIRQQAEAVKKQIQEFEAAPKDLDLKQKTVISETIMNLLLQLDTIQGLHQNLRDVRKSLARELVALQEKLDSMGVAAVTEHEERKVEPCPTAPESGHGGISPPVSNETVNLDSGHVSSQLVDATNSLEESSMDGKEAYAKQPRHVEAIMAESADSSTGPDNVKSLNAESDSISAPQGDAAESPQMEKEQPHDLEEVMKPLASASQGVSDADKQLEDNASTYQVGDEVSDHGDASRRKHDGVGLEKSSVLHGEVEGTELATEESKPELEELVEPTSRTVGVDPDSGVNKTIFPSNEVDPMEAVQVPAIDSNPEQEADKDAVEDTPCYEQAIHAIKGDTPGAMEVCREDGTSPMLMLDAIDATEPNPLRDESEIQKERCFTMGETSETNISRYDAAPTAEDMPQLVVNPEATVTEPNTVPSDDTVALNAVVDLSREENKLLEENEKLREMLERLLEAGKAQMGVLAALSGRVKNLEKKVSQKKRCKVKSLKTRKNSTALLRV